ncbi:hypothetical protein [Streptomyces yangpuensis]|uniref:hypothetical protein n=2 Tax=Streptomyces yangpuensis TaxID=1648182 RepID=UPI0037FB6B56
MPSRSAGPAVDGRAPRADAAARVMIGSAWTAPRSGHRHRHRHHDADGMGHMSGLPQDALVGSWELTGSSVRRRSRRIPVAAGGTLVYTAAGTVTTVMELHVERPLRLGRTFAYTGLFRTEGDEAVHRVGIGTWPFRPGQELRRRATLVDPDHLVLEPLHPGHGLVLSLAWRRTGTC